jgi:cytochrome c-type biogenesis protein CcsB
MRNLLTRLASLKLTVALIVLIGVVLSWGTILESLRGPAAAQVVYGAGWFYSLQALLALNVLAALVDRWPKNRWRFGFAVTHLSILVILVGAVATVLFKEEGQLVLLEGQTSGVVHKAPVNGIEGEIRLPFALHLESFEIDTYPGTHRPSMFRSRVVVQDTAKSTAFPAVIEMNKPLSYGGWRFFQSSYHVDESGRTTILSVSKDPGQPIVFLGYGLLVLGMIVVFATRLVQARQARALLAAQAPAGARLPTLGALPTVALLLAASALLAPPAAAQKTPDAATVEKLRVLPVQHDGRTMPFDTEAREAVRTVTGKTSFGGLDPVAMVAGWSFDTAGWQQAPIVAVSAETARLAGLPDGTRHASFAQLVSSPGVKNAILALRAKDDDAKPTPAEKDVQKLDARLSLLFTHFNGGGIAAFPNPDAKDAWRTAGGQTAEALASYPERIRAAGAPAHYPDERTIRREILYNKMRHTRVAWLLLLPAAVLAGLAAGGGRAALRPFVAFFVVAGFGAMTWGLATRWQVAGRIPASDMYESLLFLGWGVGLFGVVALFLKQRLLVANAAGLGALAMALSDLLPMDPFIHPMPPVLSGTPWLAIHVPIIVVSYSVLAMATGLAHLVVGVEVFAPQRRDLSARWSELLYYYLHVGTILLIAGILTGSIWAASSWGRYWGWDPKEVWSLIAFLAYMAILHARFDEQIRPFGVAVASIAAFWTILMTYLGVNFILASGLHAYGFGSSNLVLVLVTIALAEGAFLATAWSARRARATAAALSA